MSSYQLKIGYFYNIPIGTVKILVPNFFDKEKYVLYYQNLPIYLKVSIEAKKLLAY